MTDTTTAYAAPVDAPTTAIVPVCVVGDVSGSMSGAPIDAVNTGFASLIETLKINPEAADSAYVQIIKFSDTAEVVMPYTHVHAASVPPTLDVEGGTEYGAAFRLVRQELEAMVPAMKATGAVVYRPTVYFITDGNPTDAGWENELDALSTSPFAPNVCVFGVAGADANTLRSIVRRDRGQVWLADQGTDPADAFASLFPALVRTVMQSATAAAAGQPVPLPVPPAIAGMTALDPV